MSYEKKENSNQDGPGADSCALSGDLSILDELFPSLGDSSNHFTNQLAFLLNSFSSSEDDGSTTGPPLFNPLQLSPPRLNEIHALATANLISQTQEAIMQEYNIHDLDFNHIEANSNQDKIETNDISNGISVDSKNLSVNKHEPEYENVLTEKGGDTCLSTDIIVNECPFTNLSCKSAADEIASKLNSEESDKHTVHVLQSNPPVSLAPGPHYSDITVRESELLNTSSSSQHGNYTDLKTANLTSHTTIGLSSIVEKHSLTEKQFLTIPQVQQSNTDKHIDTSEMHFHNEKRLNNENISKINESIVINTDLNNRLDYNPPPGILPAFHGPDETTQIYTCSKNGLTVKNDHFKKKLMLKFEQPRDGPVDSSVIDNVMCGQGSSMKNSSIHTCIKCGKHFSDVNHLDQHKVNHQQYVCMYPGCVRTFTYRSHLSYHKKVHDHFRKEKNYGCSECGKQFTNHQHLETHMRTHNKNKPYVCKVCEKCFTTIGNLNNHSRLHTGERPFACDFTGCGKRFVESSSLKKHKVLHTGEKPYRCEICGKSFTQAGSKNYHMKKHKDTTHLKVTTLENGIA